MYFRPRHRHGAYPLAQEHTLPRGVRMLLAVGAILVAAYLMWTLVLRIFGIGGATERVGAMLAVEQRGTVTVEIDDTEQRAENGMMVFPDESIRTGSTAHASLNFFDGSRMRMDESTKLTLETSARGSDESSLEVRVEEGTVFLMTAGGRSFTGSVTWRVSSPTLNFDVPAGTEAQLSPTSIAVFSTGGDGVTVKLSGHDEFIISEGQQWSMPKTGSVSDNVFEHRSAIDARSQTPFVTESRQLLAARAAGTQATGSGAIAGRALLTVTAPTTDAKADNSTMTVRGSIGAGVTSVLVNGYPAVVDRENGTFSQQVSPPAGTTPFDITIQALDSDKTVLAEVRRSLLRAEAPPLAAPTVTVPARDGQTYQTSAEELIMRGTAPAGALGIMVNDYRLQLFDPEKGEWSYIASLRLGNMVPGTNTYDVYAIDGAGKKSAAARITIMHGEGPTGVISTGTSSSSTGLTTGSTGSLPNNAPLEPGTLKVTAPTEGTTHAETGTGFLIEGSTSAKTASISVNDYRLQLYRPGVTTWNYIAEVALNNLKPGKNVYVITARNAKDEILDTLTYTVEYTPD